MPGNEQWCQHKGWPKDRPVEEKLIESWEELSEWSSNDHFKLKSLTRFRIAKIALYSWYTVEPLKLFRLLALCSHRL